MPLLAARVVGLSDIFAGRDVHLGRLSDLSINRHHLETHRPKITVEGEQMLYLVLSSKHCARLIDQRNLLVIETLELLNRLKDHVNEIP
ncbi:hypothetical protein [Haladaptatus cibarius]|uniref:hypothetical protein n=1 Tax=Haladaptatus cibarius TaxID=453847 RepID=UPI000678D686|nr:hypothetical protein [Haladaptatus cibarius]